MGPAFGHLRPAKADNTTRWAPAQPKNPAVTDAHRLIARTEQRVKPEEPPLPELSPQVKRGGGPRGHTSPIRRERQRTVPATRSAAKSAPFVRRPGPWHGP